jgi:hypothetical protein
MTYDAVIPAGGAIDPMYAEAIGSPYRVLAPLGLDNRPVLQHIVDALRASGSVGRIICAAPEAVWPVIHGVDVWRVAGDSGPDNIRAGLAEAAPGQPALLCTSDLPLITAASICGFLESCRPEMQIAVGLVKANEYSQAFPDAPPSEFVRLSDAGSVTLGGLFLVHPALLVRQDALFRQIFQGRKDQWRLASLLGPRLLWQFATRTLRLRDIVRRAEFLLDCPVQVIPDAAPVLAYDIDSYDDYTYARTRFADFHE